MTSKWVLKACGAVCAKPLGRSYTSSLLRDLAPTRSSARATSPRGLLLHFLQVSITITLSEKLHPFILCKITTPTNTATYSLLRNFRLNCLSRKY